MIMILPLQVKPGVAQNTQMCGRCIDSLYMYILSRNLSSAKNLPLCSLDRLASDIGVVYREFSSSFPELTSEKVKDIQNRIKDGRYTLSPILVSVFFDKGEIQRPKYSHIMHLKDEPNMYYGLGSTEEDSLVLLALGKMINLYNQYSNILMNNSFGLKILLRNYYNLVCTRGTLKKLVVLDLTNSISTINRRSLLSKLKAIVKDEDILSLIEQFLYLPILDENGVDITADIGCNIPSSGWITDVILNIALSEFDMEFLRVFPEFKFTRYLHEVFVYFPTSESMLVKPFSIFEEEVLSLFEKLHLSGQILSIEPGDAPVPCLGGQVSISQDGDILVDINFKTDE